MASVWREQVRTAAEVTHARRRLRAALAAEELPEDVADQMLLGFEELVSNAVRHGRPPVVVCVSCDGGWLVEVSDAAPDRPPVPPVDRDRAHGGMGLGLVARLSTAHGWIDDGDRKTVWAWFAPALLSAAPLSQRVLRATQRAQYLAALLAATESRVAATFDRLTTEAAARAEHDRASSYRAVAGRARRDAARAERVDRVETVDRSAPGSAGTGARSARDG